MQSYLNHSSVYLWCYVCFNVDYVLLPYFHSSLQQTLYFISGIILGTSNMWVEKTQQASCIQEHYILVSREDNKHNR